jgi:predicted AlkP superfamily pyrophosphatase or phosphodiesterase
MTRTAWRSLAALLAAAVALPAHAQVPAARRAGPDRDAFLSTFARSFYPGRSGQIMIVPREGHFITRSEPENAFMHGSPWGYDTRVPLIFYGPGHVRRGRFAVPARHQDIAPTIAAMLGLPAPATMTGRALSMALRPAAAPPRVVLLVVLDAFRADYLERHAAALPTLTRLGREGASFPRAQVDYLPSATGVAHSTISTGADPSIHGISVNTVFDGATGKESDPYAGRSPRNLMAPALADLWAEATDGRAVIAAQGGLFYAAGALAGHGACQIGGRAVFAASYERTTGQWTTNPECYRLHPSLAERTPRSIWETAQGVWRGHDITGPDLVRRSALFAAYEVDSLLGIVGAEPVGADDVADLLLVNLKTPDYVGHRYGPESPEIAETVAAVDAALGRLVEAVEKKAGPGRSVVVITADHGMPGIAGDPSRRHFAAEITSGLNARLDPEGKRVVRHYEASNSQMFVDRGRLRELGLTLADVSRHLESLPFVFAAYTEDEVRRAPRR